jgi:arylesterase/paraoxonase
MLVKALLVAILAAVVYKIAVTTLNLGFHLHYKKHHPGDCRKVNGLEYGAEDFQVTKDGLAFITSGVWLPTFSPVFWQFLQSNNVKGSIYLYDFKKPELGAKRLKIKPSKDFNLDTFQPHGTSLLEDELKGEHLLYVISHPKNSDDTVEKFRYLPKTNELVHLKSFISDKFHITNDLAAVEEDKFYISNYLYFRSHFLTTVELVLLPFGLGSVLFYNGTEFTVIESGLHSPNGILLSKDKRYLYVSIIVRGIVNVYTVNADTSLTLIQSVAIHTAADNFHLSQAGDALYTGAHPVTHEVLAHLNDPALLAPSSILRLPLKNGKIVPEDITELFYDHGDLISGSSIATVYNKKLLIGSVINKLVVCDVHV